MKSFSGTANEKAWMSCIILQFQGSRSVVCASFVDVVAFMKAQGVKELKQMAVWDYLQKANMETLMKMVETFPLFYGSAGPGECFFVPFGYIVCESVSAEKDIISIRMPFLFQNGQVEKLLEGIATYSEEAGDKECAQNIRLLQALFPAAT